MAPTYQSPPARGLEYPAIGDWQDERGDNFPYADQANTAGPSTSMNARDPQGIRMEESLEPDAQAFVDHLVNVHGQPYYEGMHTDYDKHLLDHGDMVEMRHQGIPLPEGYHPHQYIELPHERRWIRDRWPDAGSSHSFTASEERALPDPTLFAGQHHHPECTCPTCDYDRYHAKHALEAPTAEMVTAALSAAMSELRGAPEPALPETTADEPYALDPMATGGGPGESVHDTDLTPDDYSIQSMGTQQAGSGEDSSGDLAFSPGQEQDPVAAFQSTAAARQYMGEGAPAGGDDVAAAARGYLEKTADVLPQAEADELIREGRGQRARNLGLLQLEGTHYEDMDKEASERGLSLDHYDDDLVLL